MILLSMYYLFFLTKKEKKKDEQEAKNKNQQGGESECEEGSKADRFTTLRWKLTKKIQLQHG